jgi:hypothetical protein
MSEVFMVQAASFQDQEITKLMSSWDEAQDDPSLWENHLHDNVVFEFPYAGPLELPEKVEGKNNCLEYLRGWYDLFIDFRIFDVKVQSLQESGMYLLEYKTKGFVAATAQPYHQENIAIIRVQDNKIIWLREYWNPVHFYEAFSGAFNFRRSLNFIDLKSVEPF